jgi:hypothetical protein
MRVKRAKEKIANCRVEGENVKHPHGKLDRPPNACHNELSESHSCLIRMTASSNRGKKKNHIDADYA